MHADDTLAWRPRAALAALLLFVAAGGAFDIALDSHKSWSSPHLWFELMLVLVSLAGLAGLAAAWQHERHALRRTRADLERQQADRDGWKARAESLLQGLALAIDEQFEAWGLTTSEAEVALLLLKGLSLKEIAAHTQRSERTIRQHAIAVYRKSGLAGRAELSAFFLEDLLLPATATKKQP